MAKTTIRKIMKIGGAVLGGLVVLVASYVGLLFYPGILFEHHLEYKNVTVYAQQEPGEEILGVLDEMDRALRTSDIYDPSLHHDIIFGHDHAVYRTIQGIKWKITYWITGLEPALTYNEAALPYVSHIITFRIPDIPGNALLHPDDGNALDLTRVLTHEVVHSLLQARLGPQAVRFPLWKQEGYAEYIAASTTILSDPEYDFWQSVEKIANHDLSWMRDAEGSYTPMQYGCQQQASIQDEDGHAGPTCYYIARVLMEYLFGIKRASFDQVMSRTVTDVGTLQEMIAAYESRKSMDLGPALAD